MTTNNDRARELLERAARRTDGVIAYNALTRAIARELDQAEARGRAEAFTEASEAVCGGGDEPTDLHVRYCARLFDLADQAADR